MSGTAGGKPPVINWFTRYTVLRAEMERWGYYAETGSLVAAIRKSASVIPRDGIRGVEGVIDDWRERMDYAKTIHPEPLYSTFPREMPRKERTAMTTPSEPSIAEIVAAMDDGATNTYYYVGTDEGVYQIPATELPNELQIACRMMFNMCKGVASANVGGWVGTDIDRSYEGIKERAEEIPDDQPGNGDTPR